MIARAKAAVHRLEAETFALYLALRDPRTPWYARAWCIFVIAHTLSPIDLIPDFIPVLGYLDDLLITPLGIWLALKLIPAQVMQAARAKAAQALDPSLEETSGIGGDDFRKFRRLGMLVVLSAWCLLVMAIGFWLFRLMQG